MIPAQPRQLVFQCQFTPRHLQPLHQVRGPGKENPGAVLHQRQPDRRGKMAFPHAGWAEDQA